MHLSQWMCKTLGSIMTICFTVYQIKIIIKKLIGIINTLVSSATASKIASLVFQMIATKFWHVIKWTNLRVCWLLVGLINARETLQYYMIILTAQKLCKEATLIKNKINFSSYIKKFIWDRLQIHIWLTVSSYGWYFRISSYITKTFLIYYFASHLNFLTVQLKKVYRTGQQEKEIAGK